jgi:hypothetical protein
MVARKILPVLLVIVSGMVGAVLSARSEEDTHVWGKPIDGLQLSLYLDPDAPQNSSMPAVRMAIMNIGNSTKMIVLGSGCGKVNEMNSVTLEVKDEQGQQRQLKDATSSLPCAGRLALFEVTLPAGSFFSTPLALQNYGYNLPTHKFEPEFRPGGDYVISAAIQFDATPIFDIPFHVPIANTPERLTSNELRVQVPAQR